MNVDIRTLTKTFGPLRANDDVTLSFAAGQIHGVLGENGAGKSTLMKLLSGFIRRDSGEILLDGKAARLNDPADALRAGIGMVHQDPLDVPAFTALENFYCASPSKLLPNRAVARRVLLELSERLGFPVPPDAPLRSLTVGQRQQLEIMRLLALGARVLILDEPTTSITAAQARALFAALRTLAAEGKTVLFVSHKLHEVADLCNTVSVLRSGRVVGDGQMSMPQPQSTLLTMMFGHQPDAAERVTAGVEAPQDVLAPAVPKPTAAAPVWELRNVAARDGALLMRGVSLHIPAGGVVGMAGLEGSGQQIVLRLLAGVLRPISGQVLINGADRTGASLRQFRADGIEYLPADRLIDGVIGPLSLSDHMALLQPGNGMLLDTAAARQSAKEAITAFNIKATPDTPIVRLSGGNQQRALLALMPERCTGILLEQPTRGLDVTSARGIWGKLMDRRADGTALVYASADLDEVLAYSDTVLVFFGGKVSAPIPRADLTEARLAELIGGVGFEAASE